VTPTSTTRFQLDVVESTASGFRHSAETYIILRRSFQTCLPRLSPALFITTCFPWIPIIGSDPTCTIRYLVFLLVGFSFISIQEAVYYQLLYWETSNSGSFHLYQTRIEFHVHALFSTLSRPRRLPLCFSRSSTAPLTRCLGHECNITNIDAHLPVSMKRLSL